MNIYRADLHIHSTLSPCGDLYMSPESIIVQATQKGLDIIGITDHNSTRQAPLIFEIGKKNGVFVMCGAEVTSKEEAHCLSFFPDIDALNDFQDYLDFHLPDIQNDVDKFGYQVCVDENEDIIYQEDRLLLSGINQSVEQIQKKVTELEGVFIPAHINRPMFSLTSQLGFVPPDLIYDALELSKHVTLEEYIAQNKYLKNASFIQSSDAHFLSDIGIVYTNLEMKCRSFNEIKMALNNIDGRRIVGSVINQ